MEYSPMDQYWIWLSSVEGLGVKKFYALLSEYEDARSGFNSQKLNSLLTRLELRGIIKKAPGGVFRAFV